MANTICVAYSSSPSPARLHLLTRHHNSQDRMYLSPPLGQTRFPQFGICAPLPRFCLIITSHWKPQTPSLSSISISPVSRAISAPNSITISSYGGDKQPKQRHFRFFSDEEVTITTWFSSNSLSPCLFQWPWCEANRERWLECWNWY